MFHKRQKLRKEDSNDILANFNNKITPIHTVFQDEDPLTAEHLLQSLAPPLNRSSLLKSPLGLTSSSVSIKYSLELC